MIQFPIPLGTCTAFPLKMFLEYTIVGASSTITNPTSTFDIYSLPLEVSGNNVANINGGIVPTARLAANTLSKTANDAQLIPALQFLPIGAAYGDAFSTVSDKIHSIQLCEIDISDFYEEDLVAMRIELDALDPNGGNIAVWSLVAEGVSHKDGKGIGI